MSVILSDDDIVSLGENMCKCIPDCEREIRFTNLSMQQYNYFLDKMFNLKKIRGEQMTYIQENSVTEISATNNKNVTFRRTYYPNGSYRLEYKERSFWHVKEDWGIKFSVSKETPVTLTNVPFMQTISRTRYRSRNTFIDRKSESAFNGIKIECSIVRTNNSFNTYEIELELFRDIDPQQLKHMVLLVYGWIHQAEAKEHIISLTSQLEVIKKIGTVFRMHDVNEISINLMNKPKNLANNDDLNNVVKNDYQYTVKYDGIRALCYIDKNHIYLYTFNNNVLLLEESETDYVHKDTLLDGEWMSEEKKFYIFDMISFCSNDFRHHSFSLRQQCIQMIPETDTIKHKKYYTNYRPCYEVYHKAEKKYDGIIFQPIKSMYNNDYTYKWKPPHLNSIDFYVKKESVGQYSLYCVENGALHKFNGTTGHPYQKLTPIENDLFELQNPDGRIIEFAFNNNVFVPLRYRSDKQCPNSVKTAIHIYSTINYGIDANRIYNKLVEKVQSDGIEELKGSPMRRKLPNDRGVVEEIEEHEQTGNRNKPVYQVVDETERPNERPNQVGEKENETI